MVEDISADPENRRVEQEDGRTVAEQTVHEYAGFIGVRYYRDLRKAFLLV